MKTLERQINEAKTKKEFKQVVWFYDIWGRFTESKAEKVVVELAGIKDGSSILDVACGTGEMLKKIVKLNPGGANIGIDLSPDMLAKAKKKLEKADYGNFELKEGNALQLNFPDNTFDLLVNSYMVDLLPVQYFNTVASEFFRVLKPNGSIVISTFSFGTKKIHRFWFFVSKHFPKLLTGCRPVRFRENLINAGFRIENEIEISQNTFPSQIIKAVKTL